MLDKLKTTTSSKKLKLKLENKEEKLLGSQKAFRKMK
jgi:hypothetical protein